MNQAVIDDLKQFIQATVVSEGKLIRSELRSDFRSEINGLERRLTARIDSLALSVADALDVSNNANDPRFRPAIS